MKQLILIVDDEPHVRLNYRTALETEGYTVMEANSAEQALELALENKFDLATLDLRMPECDGLELLARLRSKGLRVPVIIITAYGDVPQAVQAMKLGAIDFLQKPITPEALRATVFEVLSRHAIESAPAEIPPNDYHSHVTTAKRLINLQDFFGASGHLVKALEVHPDSPEALNLVGVLCETQGDYKSAKKYYGDAIKYDSRFEPAQQNMRRIFELFHFGESKEPLNLGDE
jgi:DNA-binding response OmpR family regulator